jgi:hypothetical protein
LGLFFIANSIRLAEIGYSLDHRLHGITIVGLSFGVLGALYLSYELLDRRHGLLRRLLQIVTPGLVMAFPWLMLTFACFILAFILQITGFLVSFFSYVGYFFAVVAAIFGMIGLLSGIFLEDEDITEEIIRDMIDKGKASTKKIVYEDIVADDTVERKEYKILKIRIDGQVIEVKINKDNNIEGWEKVYESVFLLQDGIKGFVCSFVYWLLILIFLFAIDVTSLDKILLICFAYAVVGGVAGILWKFANQNLVNHSDNVYTSPLIALNKGLGENIKQFVQFVRWALKTNSTVKQKKIEVDVSILDQIMSFNEQGEKSIESRFWLWLWIGLLAVTVLGLYLYPYTYPLIVVLTRVLTNIHIPLVVLILGTGVLSALSTIVIVITIRLGIAASNTSRYIFTMVNNLPGRQVGVIGVSLTLIGFLVQLVEPLYQFFR